MIFVAAAAGGSWTAQRTPPGLLASPPGPRVVGVFLTPGPRVVEVAETLASWLHGIQGR